MSTNEDAINQESSQSSLVPEQRREMPTVEDAISEVLASRGEGWEPVLVITYEAGPFKFPETLGWVIDTKHAPSGERGSDVIIWSQGHWRILGRVDELPGLKPKSVSTHMKMLPKSD